MTCFIQGNHSDPGTQRQTRKHIDHPSRTCWSALHGKRGWWRKYTVCSPGPHFASLTLRRGCTHCDPSLTTQAEAVIGTKANVLPANGRSPGQGSGSNFQQRCLTRAFMQVFRVKSLSFFFFFLEFSVFYWMSKWILQYDNLFFFFSIHKNSYKFFFLLFFFTHTHTVFYFYKR